MIARTMRRIPALLGIIALAMALTLVPRAASVSAQSTPGTAPPPILASGVCGTIGAFTAATSTSTGTLTIGSATFTIAPGVTLTGQDLLVARGVGSTLCFIPGQLNASNQIMGGTILSSIASTLTVCGVVTAYTANSTLSIGGLTFLLDSSTTFVGNGGAGPTVGQNEEIALTISPLGLVDAGVINGTPSCAPGTTTITGTFDTFTPPNGTVPGVLTIGPNKYFVAPGTNVTATHGVPLAASTVRGHRHVGSIATQRAQ